jgi:hypothetical protein
MVVAIQPKTLARRKPSIAWVKPPDDFVRRHWFGELGLFLGAWRGVNADRTGYWLRWWDGDGTILPWATERLEQEKQRAEQEKQRADRLAEILRAQGIDPDSI